MGTKNSKFRHSHDNIYAASFEKSILSTTPSIILEDMIPLVAQPYRLGSEPANTTLKFHCPGCEKDLLDKGLGNPMRCYNCKQIFIRKNNETKILKDNKKLMAIATDSALFNHPSKPELQRIVISVNNENLPQNLKFLDKIDYSAIVQEHLLPFFKERVRFVESGETFQTSDNLRFKVSFCEPNFGCVSSNTAIHCYKEIRLHQAIKTIIFAPCNMRNYKPITVENIMEYFKEQEFSKHVELNEVWNIAGCELKVLNANPRNGKIIQTTKIKLKKAIVEKALKVTLICFLEQFLVLKKNQQFEGMEEQFASKMIRPFCDSIPRYAKAGKSMKLLDYEILVHEVYPEKSLITNKTIIDVKVFKNQTEYQRHKYDIPSLQPTISLHTQDNQDDGDSDEGIVADTPSERENARRPPASFIIKVSLEKVKNKPNRSGNTTRQYPIQASNVSAGRRDNAQEDEEEKKVQTRPQRRTHQHEAALESNSRIIRNIVDVNMHTYGHHDSVETRNRNNSSHPEELHETIAFQTPNTNPALRKTTTITQVTNHFDVLNGPVLGAPLRNDRSPGASMNQLNRLAESNPRGARENRIVGTLGSLQQQEILERPGIHRSVSPLSRDQSQPVQDRVRVAELRIYSHNRRSDTHDSTVNGGLSPERNERPRRADDLLLLDNYFRAGVQLRGHSRVHRGHRSVSQRRKEKNKGATQKQIDRLPERNIDLEFMKEHNLLSEEFIRCLICLTDYEHNETVRTMPCLHYFHKECLDEWLKKNKICPVCRASCDA